MRSPRAPRVTMHIRRLLLALGLTFLVALPILVANASRLEPPTADPTTGSGGSPTTSPQDPAIQDGGMPGTGTPGTAAPTTAVPDTAVPDTEPDTAVPDTAVPDTAVPDTRVPGSVRVLIDTDLGGDPDDIQSLVRAIHYSDALHIEGIVSTDGPGAAKPNLIREWIKRTDVDHLREQGYTDLMTEAELLAAVKAGEMDRRGPAKGRSTEGSRHIIARAHAGSKDDPLWVLAWGSLGTVAQALRDAPTIAPKIRIYSIGDYNSRANPAARDYLLGFLDRHPDLWWIENGVLPLESRSTFRGVWFGGEQSGEWNRVTFLEDHIRGHGTTSNGRFGRKLGDVFPVADNPAEAVGALKEGDTPSLLYLLSPRFGGIGDIEDPTAPSWGGQFRQADPDHPNYYVDLDCAEKEVCQATINQHRVDFLSHWRDRWDRYEVPATASDVTMPE